MNIFEFEPIIEFIIIIIIIPHNGKCFSFSQLHFKPVSSSKADNQANNLPHIGFDPFRRLHVSSKAISQSCLLQERRGYTFNIEEWGKP